MASIDPLAIDYPDYHGENCLNATLPCSGFGSCVVSANANNQYVCSCESFRNPLTNCSTTFFQDYNGRATPVVSVLLVLNLTIMILVAMEIYIDIRVFAGRVFKMPPWFSKLILFIYYIIENVYLSTWIYSSTSRDFISSGHQSLLKVLVVAAGVLVLAADILCILFWFDLVLSAKALGIKLKVIRPTKIFYYFIFAAIIPLDIICRFLAEFRIGRSIASMITQICDVILLASVVLITTGFIIKISLWSFKHKGRGGKTLNRVFMKNRWVMLFNISCIAQVVVAFALSRNTELPGSYLTSFFVLQFIGTVVAAFAYLFVENYLLQRGFFRGYILGLSGDIAGLRVSAKTTRVKSSTPNSTTSSSSKASTESTKHLETDMSVVAPEVKSSHSGSDITHEQVSDSSPLAAMPEQKAIPVAAISTSSSSSASSSPSLKKKPPPGEQSASASASSPSPSASSGSETSHSSHSASS